MLSVEADLTFTAEASRPSRPRLGRPIDRVEGRVTGRGRVITVSFSRTPSLVAPASRNLAGALADQLDQVGLTVRIAGPDQVVIAELGHRVRSPLWQLPLTRNRLIHLRSIRAGLRSIRGPKLFVAALPSKDVFGRR